MLQVNQENYENGEVIVDVNLILIEVEHFTRFLVHHFVLIRVEDFWLPV